MVAGAVTGATVTVVARRLVNEIEGEMTSTDKKGYNVNGESVPFEGEKHVSISLDGAHAGGMMQVLNIDYFGFILGMDFVDQFS